MKELTLPILPRIHALKKYLVPLMFGAAAILFLSGCGSAADQGTPYPDTYYIPPAVEADSQTSSSAEQGSAAAEAAAPDAEAATAPPEVSPIITPSKLTSTIRYFLDTSGSMSRSPAVIKVHSAATKCAAGFEDRRFYGVDSYQYLRETTEELALSGQYGYGAPLDMIENGTLPYDPEGVNILTTDLQSNTSGTELGRWLAESGCTGYSCYVFNMQYDGSLEFSTYTSNSTFEQVSVSDCSFEREFLMIVFGNNDLVQDFDANFQSKLGSDIDYDTCHVSIEDEDAEAENLLTLTSCPCFEDNTANVTFSNTNFVYGMQQVDPGDTEFTCDNTFVYKKSSKSTTEAKDAVKAVLYAVPDEPIPDIEAVEVTGVQAYNEETGCYEDSDVTFEVETEALLDGLPAVNEDPESDRYEILNKALGGAIVEDGPVFKVTIQNEALPTGLFAAEVQITFEETGEVVDLQDFAASHSAGLEEYSAALQTECEAMEIDGVTSSTAYTYTGDANGSVFRKLLDFEGVTDELIAAGAVSESEQPGITIRLVIDNR